MFFKSIAVLTILYSVSTFAARDNNTCGITLGQPLSNAYGPFDFTNPQHAARIPVVLGAHFTKNIEQLVSGNTDSIDAEIDYTLRAIPNYHRALYSISKFERKMLRRSQQEKVYTPTYYSADCYFKRAIYFQPSDAITRMLYAMHLQSSKKVDEAKTMYEQALSLGSNNPELHYNAGLFYVSINMLEKAEYHAKIAYSGGYPLAGLRRKIEGLKQKNDLTNSSRK